VRDSLNLTTIHLLKKKNIWCDFDQERPPALTINYIVVVNRAIIKKKTIRNILCKRWKWKRKVFEKKKSDVQGSRVAHGAIVACGCSNSKSLIWNQWWKSSFAQV